MNGGSQKVKATASLTRSARREAVEESLSEYPPLPLTMRTWLRGAELNALLTRELQKIAGSEGSTLSAGPQIAVTDSEHSNWAGFTVTPAPGSDKLGRAVGAVVMSVVRESCNVVG